MLHAILSALSLVDISGQLIIAAIVVCLIAGAAANVFLRARYAAISRDLRENPDHHKPFSHPVLENILREARVALLRTREVNTQAVIEQQFQTELKPLLIAERFVRSCTGLLIILGLVGTFYGLTLSIGRLVALVAADAPVSGDITQALTKGLTEALSGMSVAFTTSLFGIIAAIVMMLLGIASNVTDQRTALMVQIENYVDHVLRTEPVSAGEARTNEDAQKLQQIVQAFSNSVTALDAVVTRFDASLQGFAATTRDFREFNLHLKDNVQRMSLSFGDFSEALKTELVALRPTGK
jgi:methyl-accepting chemotaxis protein